MDFLGRHRLIGLERESVSLLGYWGRSQHLNFGLLLGNY